MTRQEILRGLRIERECISRDCDRDCANCDIVQERNWLLQIYDGAIHILEELDGKYNDNYTMQSSL